MTGLCKMASSGHQRARPMANVTLPNAPARRTVSNTVWPDCRNERVPSLSEEAARILSVAAHDLRNPVSAIIALAETLMDQAGERLDAFERGLLTDILNTSEVTINFIENLLDVSLGIPGELRISPVDLRGLANESIAMNRAICVRREIELVHRGGNRLPIVNADRLKILRVLNELLRNAIEISRPGQTVEVRLRVRGGFVEIAVRDQGTGITPGDLNKLFTPFPKIQTSAGAMAKRGRGLGLAIVREIVEAHHGRVHATSKTGEGSTFTVSLPIAA